MQRPPNDRGSPARVRVQRFVQRIKRFLAALEEGAERGEGEVFRAAGWLRQARFHQQVENRRREDVLGEIVRADELAAGIALERLQPRQMRRLRRARGVRRHMARSTHGFVGGLGDDQQLAMIEREPRLPLCVGDFDAVAQRLAERRQIGDEIGIFRQQRVDVALERRRAGHVADEMHDAVAMRDIDVEFIENAAPEVLEVLLDRHFDVVPREVGAEQIAIGAELVGDRRQKDLHRFRHGRARRGVFRVAVVARLRRDRKRCSAGTTTYVTLASRGRRLRRAAFGFTRASATVAEA